MEKDWEQLKTDMEKILAMAGKEEWEPLKQARILVTGANGLIGSMILRGFFALSQKEGWNPKVIGVVRNAGGAVRQFADILGGMHLCFLEQDLTEPLEVPEEIDYIIHGASPTKSGFFLSNPVETFQSIVIGTEHVLKLARKKQCRAMVYLSSMEVYGKITHGKPLREEEMGYLNPTALRSSYPMGKRAAEGLCAAYGAEYGVPVRIVRLAQTFGPGIPPEDNRVFAQFLHEALNGKDIVLYTEGGSAHMYLDTMDAVGAVLLLLIKGKSGQAYNAAKEENYCSIRDMAKLVLARFGNGQGKLVIDRSKDMGQYPAEHKMKLDVSRLRELGWQPRYDLVEMYERMIADMR